MIRLVLLLAGLGLAFYGVMSMRLPAPVPRVAQVQPVAEPVQPVVRPSAPDTRALPASVRRLADSPVTGPMRPVIVQDAVIDPAAVQPMSAPRLISASADASAPRATPSGFRRVVANSINVRGGPSTGFEVVGRLARDEEVEVIEASDAGWMRIRIQGDGVEGWVAARLLSQ